MWKMREEERETVVQEEGKENKKELTANERQKRGRTCVIFISGMEGRGLEVGKEKRRGKYN